MHSMTAPAVLGPGTAQARQPVKWLLAFRRWRLERRTERALAALNDSTLKDMGIYRCQIPGIARSVWTDPRLM
jgi:uncharacterized protein YjiS (DUF1127 family)